MKHIPKDFIFELVARSNIVDIVSERVKIKKKGNNYFGCCPFHNEKTPSFSVNDKKQIFYCFGCGASGSVIDFLMEFDRLSFIETVEELANWHGLTVPYTQKSDNKNKNVSAHNTRAELYALTHNIAEFYHRELNQPEAKKAQEYLKKRGLDKTVIDRFTLGYAPDSWEKTYQTLARNSKQREWYQQVGMLVTQSNQRPYDRFRGRVMFPIRDRRGNVIGFGGRTIKNNDTVKYLNSPETILFHKGRQLYGLYEALSVNRNPAKLIVVEGYMDVVSLAQFDINYAVAALGTATTAEHINLLFRTTDTVLFCYDGDTAGKRAAWRALTTLLPALQDGKEIKFVFLPEGDDPDSFIHTQGKVQFERLLEEAQPLSTFLFDGLLKQAKDISTPEGKARLSNLAIPLINQVGATNYTHSLRRKLGDYLGLLDALQIHALFNHIVPATPLKKTRKKSGDMKLTTMRILIGLLLQYPNLSKLVNDTDSLRHASVSGIDVFLSLLSICNRYPDMTTAQLLAEFSPNGRHPHLSYLKQLAVWEHRYEEEHISIIFKNTLKALYDTILTKRQESLIAKARITGLNNQEKKELTTLLVLLKNG